MSHSSAPAPGGGGAGGGPLAVDELEKHVQKKYEILAKLGKGACEFRAGARRPRGTRPRARGHARTSRLGRRSLTQLHARPAFAPPPPPQTASCGRPWTGARSTRWR